jgi:hypothetical protein
MINSNGRHRIQPKRDFERESEWDVHPLIMNSAEDHG